MAVEGVVGQLRLGDEHRDPGAAVEGVVALVADVRIAVPATPPAVVPPTRT
jgi:hypothetical protein